MNSQWLSVACSLARPFTLDRYQRTWGERFVEFRPWLVPTEELGTCMNCPRTGPNNPCVYRVVEINDNKFVGICDTGLCDERPFTRAQLVQYQIDFARLNIELATLLGHQTRPVNNEGCWLLDLGTRTSGDDPLAIHLVGGTDQNQQLREMRSRWNQSDQRRMLLFPLSRMVTESISNFIKRAGWSYLVLEGHIEMTAHGVAWLPGGRERWEQLLAGVPLNQMGEAPALFAYKHSVAIAERIERKIEAVGVEMGTLRKENDTLRLQLGNQLTSLAGQVESEFFHWVCTVLMEGSMLRASTRLDLPHTTFRERFNRYVKKGGIYRALASLVEVRRKGLGSRKLESLNPTFEGHQNPSGPVYDNRALLELLDALRSLNEDNWEHVRGEMLEILAEMNG